MVAAIVVPLPLLGSQHRSLKFDLRGAIWRRRREEKENGKKGKRKSKELGMGGNISPK